MMECWQSAWRKTEFREGNRRGHGWLELLEKMSRNFTKLILWQIKIIVSLSNNLPLLVDVMWESVANHLIFSNKSYPVKAVSRSLWISKTQL